MHPAAIIRELRDGQSPAVRTGLAALLLGAFVSAMIMVLLAPSMNGLVGLPGHTIGKDPTGNQVRTRPSAPPLTLAQRGLVRRKAVFIAAKEVGVTEWAGHPNYSNRIVTFRRAVQGRGENPYSAEPWCADFVSWTYRRAGVPIGFDGRGSDYVPELVAWGKLTGRWRNARSRYHPLPGDLIIYSAGGSRFGHIGLVAKVGGGRVRTIEGNSSNRVKRRVVKPWDATVQGFIRPV
jgi:hypothetical protein